MPSVAKLVGDAKAREVYASLRRRHRHQRRNAAAIRRAARQKDKGTMQRAAAREEAQERTFWDWVYAGVPATGRA